MWFISIMYFVDSIININWINYCQVNKNPVVEKEIMEWENANEGIKSEKIIILKYNTICATYITLYIFTKISGKIHKNCM